MNIVYHFRVRGTGAEGVHIAGIADGFRALGHRVRFVSPSGIDPTAPQTVALEKPRPRMLHTIADRAPQWFFEMMEVGYNAFATPSLARAVRKERPELIYERYAFFNMAGATLSRTLNVPLILEVNELAGYERVREQRFVKLAQAAERYIFRRARLIVTVSDFLTQRVQKIVDGEVPVVTIPNGVSQKWLAHAPPQSTVEGARLALGLAKRRVIAFSGGLVHWHNFGLLLQALATLRPRFPDVALLFIGDGALKKQISDEADALGLSDSVVFAGQVSHDDVLRYLALADVTIIPQSNEYRSPIKMFEYMALAKPVVAPRLPPIAAVLRGELGSYLFEPGDVDGMTQALEHALADPARAQRIGAEGQRTVLSRYTWEANARRILSLATPREPHGLRPHLHAVGN